MDFLQLLPAKNHIVFDSLPGRNRTQRLSQAEFGSTECSQLWQAQHPAHPKEKAQ